MRLKKNYCARCKQWKDSALALGSKVYCFSCCDLAKEDIEMWAEIKKDKQKQEATKP